MCCLSDDFKTYHMEKWEENISDDDIKAKELLEKAEENGKRKTT